MSKPLGTAVRLLYRDEQGNICDTRGDYDLDDFGGVLPAVGDRIVEPGVAGGRDPREPENRTVYTVEERYFQPGTTKMTDLIWVHLVVSIRQADESERLVACRA